MSARVLEYGPVAVDGGFFARDLQVGDVIRDPEGAWRRVVAIEDSPHGERFLEVAGGNVIVSDLVEDEIFAILPGTFLPLDVIVDEAEDSLQNGYLDQARSQAIIAYGHRDATEQQRQRAGEVLAIVYAQQQAIR